MSVSRRDFLTLVGTSVAVVAAVGSVAGLALGTSASGAAPAGASVGDAWRVASIGAVQKGAVPIRLVHVHTGEALLIDACRRGSSRPPVASSARFDLYLANNGAGRAPTPQAHVAAARALAVHLDRHVDGVPAPLLTLDARHAQHAELFERNDDFAVG